MAVVAGAFNIITRQFLGNDPRAYLIRDPDSHLIVWGMQNTDTGEFIATRNPIKYDHTGGVRYGSLDPKESNKVSGYILDNTTDYRGSKFVDTAFEQYSEAGGVSISDALALAEHLSQEAKTAKIAMGLTKEVADTRFFKNEKSESQVKADG